MKKVEFLLLWNLTCRFSLLGQNNKLFRQCWSFSGRRAGEPKHHMRLQYHTVAYYLCVSNCSAVFHWHQKWDLENVRVGEVCAAHLRVTIVCFKSSAWYMWNWVLWMYKTETALLQRFIFTPTHSNTPTHTDNRVSWAFHLALSEALLQWNTFSPVGFDSQPVHCK